MLKSFVTILLSGIYNAPIGAKTTIINTGKQSIFVASEEEVSAINSSLEEEQAYSVLEALYSIKPGQTKALKAGAYVIDLNRGSLGSAVLQIEVKKPKEEPKKEPEPLPNQPE